MKVAPGLCRERRDGSSARREISKDRLRVRDSAFQGDLAIARHLKKPLNDAGTVLTLPADSRGASCSEQSKNCSVYATRSGVDQSGA